MSENKETYETVVQQRDELAFENSFLISIMKEQSDCFDAAISEGFLEEIANCNSDSLIDIYTRRLSKAIQCIPPTPATDAFTIELMAKGVDALAVKYRNMIETMHPDTIAYGALKQEFESVIKEANKFAAQLRKGINDAQ